MIFKFDSLRGHVGSADENLPKRLDATLLQRMLDDNGGNIGTSLFSAAG